MRIELDAQTKIITVHGVKISLELLKTLANPDPSTLYRLTRKGDVVTVQTFDPRREPQFSRFS